MRNTTKVKKYFCLLIFIWQLVLFTGCHISNNKEKNIWQIQSFNCFDTVSTIYSYSYETKESFNENATSALELLSEYHKLFDIYYEYQGINNLKTINDNPTKEIKVDKKLIDFLLYTKEIYELTNGKTNVMLGPVLKLWHDARENASYNPNNKYIPSITELETANLYTDINYLIIDEQNNTIKLDNPNARIDVGALGKGYATEMVAKMLIEKGITSYVLDIGGNIRIIGSKQDGTGWNTGIRSPFDKSKYALYLNIKDISCVTSGDYERYFIYENNKYHHIIDPVTLMPADYFSSVTILSENSGLADALSTALFSMNYEEGRLLVDSLDNVEAVWIYKNGNIIYTDGVNPINL